jgi:RecA/RadA recombinase
MSTNVVNVNKSDLGYLGEDYQKKLVKCFIEDQQFFIELYNILDQNKFTNDNLRRIVGYMKDRYAEVEVVPTYSELKMIIKTRVADPVASDVLMSFLLELYHMPMESIDIIKDSCSKFFKQQNLIRAMKEADDIIRIGDFNRYDDILQKIQKAIEVNEQRDGLAWQLFDNIESDLSENYRIAIPTGADKLDEALYGGLGKGQLGIIIAPMGTGKTSATTGFAANAALHKCEENNFKGWKVLHIFFEDTEVDIRRKYYGFATDYDAMLLSDPSIRPHVIEILNENSDINRMLKENIRCKRMDSLETSASDIEMLIKREIAIGFKPDLVIIDYFECLAPERVQYSQKGDSWEKEGITIRKLEKMTHKFNVGMWIPVQGNRESIGLEKVGLAQGGGSIKKTQAAHVVLTFAQTDDQKPLGKMNMFLAKLRSGKIVRNQFFGIHFNNGTCKFDMSNIDADTEAIENNSTFERQQQAAAQVAKNEYKRMNKT